VAFSRVYLSIQVMRCLFLFCFTFSSISSAVDFNRDVRPVLAQQCFSCHGMDEHGRKGKLRLDLSHTAYGAGKSGEIAIVPAKPDESEVIKRIFSTDEDEIMPPPHTKKVMSAKDKETLRAWIAEGAKYEAHWAYQKPQPQAKVPTDGHPVDYFIRKELEQAGLKPSAPADAYTLVRRLYLDLIGLPPTIEEADAFVQAFKQSPKAYEELVDQLLASKHYGERWARRWLDLARYADTNGFEKDRPRQIWPYRDWVVKALNEDMPFDQFSIKQLAGDMLPKATPDDLIATGFHRNTMLNEEGGIDPNEYRFYAMVDRVGVTGTAWMGLTLNCCQCHTHKYDPILHTDYFSVMALLNNADEPTYHIPTAATEAQAKAHKEKIAKLEAELPSKYPGGKEAMLAAFEKWKAAERPKASSWTVLRPTEMKTTMPHLKQLQDGFILGSGDISKSDVYDLKVKADLKGVTALRLEVASHPSLPNDGPGLTNYEGPLGGFFLSEIQARQNDQRLPIKLAQASNDQEEDRISDAAPAKKKKGKGKPKTNNAASALDGEMSSGWQVLGGYGQYHTAVFHFEKPADFTAGVDLKMMFEKHFACPLGHFRLSVTKSDHATATGHPAEVEEALFAGKDEGLLTRFLESTPEMAKTAAPLLAARRNPPRGQPTLVMQERPVDQPRATHRYHRGEYLSPKEEVPPAVPAFLPQLPKDAPANRMSFAKWLFSADNPLTARVTVNRQWQAFFGVGLVKSLEDFGYQSDAPSHPELLDWLAVELMKQKWSIKKLHRLIVTSETYKQSSRRDPSFSADANNALLSRGARFRLDAEVIRDSVLKAAGLLSPKMGGPGVYPPQPASVTSEGTYGKVDWKTSEGEDRYRRSLYTFIKRTAPFAMATTFDAPTGEACLARRDVSNSPLQALTLLNDQMFVEAAQAMAKQVMQASPADDARLVNAFRRCLTRPPASDELELLQRFLNEQRQSGLKDAALWSAVCRAILNLDEAITHP
jgi:hypothetical protein